MSEFGPLVSLNDPAFIDPSVQIYGRVTVAAGASLWPNTVIRAEQYEVRIGASTNIQDFTMIHVGGSTGTFIGAHCSITHHCTIHGCTIGDNCLIGINATVMDGAVIGDNCIVAGGAFVKERTVVPANSIVMGIPAKAVREQNNWVANRFNAWLYEHNARAYARGEHRAWDGAAFLESSKEKMTELQAEFAAL
jgi:carbonic anhydrase/acetyltransferase-like protein (isoleucine patch superfamily)